MTFVAADSAFFTVSFPDYGSGFESMAQDIIGLEVTEEMDKAIQGSLTLRDDSFLFSRIARNNAEMLIGWGWKRNNFPLQSAFDSDTADVLLRPLERRGLKVRVLSPSGGGSSAGTHTFSCGFMSSGWFGNKEVKVFESGTKGTVVAQILRKLGAVQSYVKFARQNEAYSSESVERQCETDFQFLVRLGREWRCVFRLGFLPSGGLAGIFCEPRELAACPITQALTGAKTNRLTLDWRDGPSPNVLSYNWKNQEGENGAGDNVQVTYVNGQPVIQRFTVKDDVVTTWQVNMARISAKVAEASNMGTAAELTAAAMRADSLEDPSISWAFDMVSQRTAPNGYGYSVTGEMLGEPMATCGTMATLRNGFPDCLRLDPMKKEFSNVVSGNAVRDFWMRKVTHSISRSGYKCGFEIVDNYTQMGLLGG